jgi:hypothetical protein
MMVAPLTGYWILPFSTQKASLAEKTNLPLVMSTWPPPKLVAYRPRLMLAMISPCARLVAGQHVGVGHARHRHVA